MNICFGINFLGKSKESLVYNYSINYYIIYHVVYQQSDVISFYFNLVSILLITFDYSLDEDLITILDDSDIHYAIQLDKVLKLTIFGKIFK